MSDEIIMQKIASECQQTIDDHCDRQGWVIDDKAHGLNMILTDLMAYATKEGISFSRELERAKETFSECY